MGKGGNEQAVLNRAGFETGMRCVTRRIGYKMGLRDVIVDDTAFDDIIDELGISEDCYPGSPVTRGGRRLCNGYRNGRSCAHCECAALS